MIALGETLKAAACCFPSGQHLLAGHVTTASAGAISAALLDDVGA